MILSVVRLSGGLVVFAAQVLHLLLLWSSRLHSLQVKVVVSSMSSCLGFLLLLIVVTIGALALSTAAQTVATARSMPL